MGCLVDFNKIGESENPEVNAGTGRLAVGAGNSAGGDGGSITDWSAGLQGARALRQMASGAPRAAYSNVVLFLLFDFSFPRTFLVEKVMGSLWKLSENCIFRLEK